MGAVAHINDYKDGHFFSNETRGDMSWNGYEHNVLLRNLGTDANGIPQFVDVAMALGVDDIIDSRGVGLIDYDNDGDLDLAVSHNPGDLYQEEGIAPGLFRNDLGQSESWLAVSLVGKNVNRDAIGAEVTARAGDLSLTRLVSAGSGYASQSSSRLYLGLGGAEVVSTLSVRWGDGTEEQFSNLKARHLVRITQGGGIEVMKLPQIKRKDLVSTVKPSIIRGGPR